MYTSIACLYFLQLIEAASRPAGMSGICREVVRHLSCLQKRVMQLSCVCQVFAGNLSGLIALFICFGVQGGKQSRSGVVEDGFIHDFASRMLPLQPCRMGRGMNLLERPNADLGVNLRGVQADMPKHG